MSSHPTQFQELNVILRDLVQDTKDILSENFVGAYLVGSFAVGDADTNSDCDFLIVVHRKPNATEEAKLRNLHDEIPTLTGFWTKHLEGSYPVQDDLSTLDGLGRKWLYIDHGHRQMQWSTHCNSLEHRWSLRERGVVLAGPDPKTFTAAIPHSVMRKAMSEALLTVIPDMEGWIKVDDHTWAQRYIVTTICRILYSITTGQVASKKAALEWAKANLHPKWSNLLQQSLDGRGCGFDPDAKPAPELVEQTLEFADYAKTIQFTPLP